MAEPGRTEKATPRRREEARKKGTVARSTEVNSTLILLGIIIMFRNAGGYIFDNFHKVISGRFAALSSAPMSIDDVGVFSLGMALDIGRVLAPIALIAFAVALLSNLIQVGFLFSFEPIKPKGSNINPVAGFKRLFSRRSLVELIKSILKLFIIGMVAYYTLSGRIEELKMLMGLSVWEIAKYIAELAYVIMLRVVLVLLVIAVLDYLYQRWEYEDSLKMTKQEVRDEYKQMEGDPLVKSRIAKLQKEYARRRMMTEIPEADVVVTNPTHYAVALRYNRETDPAPIVVGKGARMLALRIKEIAEQHGVPIVENPELARALYAGAEVGDEIAEDLFSSVAEVLAYVYRMNERRVEMRPQTT